MNATQQIIQKLKVHTNNNLNYEPMQPREREEVEQMCRALQLDGLLAHSTVSQLLNTYSFIYDRSGRVPIPTEISLQLKKRHKKLKNISRQKDEHLTKINQNSQIISYLESILQDSQRQLAILKETNTKQKQNLNKFEDQQLPFVREQNRKLQQGTDKSQNGDEQIKLKLIEVECQIEKMRQEYCGQHPFPFSKGDAMELLNMLDSQMTMQHVRNISK